MMNLINKKNIRVWSMLGMRRVVGMMLDEMSDWDNFIFLTADVARYFGTEKFEKEHPDKIMDVGIAEQNLIGISGGLAKEGMNVFAATYATFLTSRALDFIRVNMGYMKLKVKLIGVGGGLSEGDLSATHMALEDIANITAIPNITVISPSDALELVKVLLAVKDYSEPVYIRLTGKTNTPIIYKEDFEYKIGKANILKQGRDIALITNGVITQTALEVSLMLEEEGYTVAVIDMHTIKPLDTDTLNQYLSAKLIVSIQEHMTNCGMSGMIASHLARQGCSAKFLDIGIDDFYPPAAEYEDILTYCGLDKQSIYHRIKGCLANEMNQEKSDGIYG